MTIDQNNINLGHTTTSLESLNELMGIASELSIERFNPKVDFKKINKLFPNFVSKIKSFMDMALANEIKNDFYQADPKKLSKYIRDTKLYPTLVDKPIFVPKGLNTDYLTYMNTLGKFQMQLVDIADKILIPFERVLATLLTNPTSLNSNRDGAMDIITRYIDRDLGDRRDTLKKLFDISKGEQAPFGQLVKRMSDIPDIFSKYTALTDEYARIDIEHIKALITTIISHMDAIIENLQDDPEVYKMSGVTVASLSSVTYSIASEIEYVAVHGYQLEYLGASIEDATKVIQGK